MNQSERMKELVELLSRASEAYYAKDEEIMSNYTYDALYDELLRLEEETGIVLAGSPTVNIGYEAVDNLPKERHDAPMLSLNKTKSREELRDWLQGKIGLLSWKLDGLTVVLTYENGELTKAVTRGNGEVGEVVTGNAKVFTNIPLHIAFRGKMILRGEAVISYSDFEQINERITDVNEKYKNPRNLCSGSVRQLNNRITAERKVRFYAFSLVSAEGETFETRTKQFEFMRQLGFETVSYRAVEEDTIADAIAVFEREIETNDIPSDGLVLIYDDIAYGKSLGRTAKFPRDAIAFKWADEIRETVLRRIEWSPSRTGLINPVAIFDSVELEGTTVSRASVHNISVMRSLKLGIGDSVTVYKANMIIPQIAENLTGSNNIEIPTNCPVCGAETTISNENEIQYLFCPNPICPVKKVKAFAHFVSRDALNVEGLSESTLEKLISANLIHEFVDIFRLSRYRDEIVVMEGLGEKSYENLIASINKAREVTVPKLIFALGIANIGPATAKLISKAYGDDLMAIQDAKPEDLAQIDGIGEVIAEAFCDYFRQDNNCRQLSELMQELHLLREETKPQVLSGKVFVITGSLNKFADRSELKEAIEARGGKVSGSVTGNTDCLINNDVLSSSSKNKKAKELGIPIISEEEFTEIYHIEGTKRIDL